VAAKFSDVKNLDKKVLMEFQIELEIKKMWKM
jgi:hypothetical protein